MSTLEQAPWELMVDDLERQFCYTRSATPQVEEGHTYSAHGKAC